jgi:hypothetical protein
MSIAPPTYPLSRQQIGQNLVIPGKIIRPIREALRDNRNTGDGPMTSRSDLAVPAVTQK